MKLSVCQSSPSSTAVVLLPVPVDFQVNRVLVALPALAARVRPSKLYCGAGSAPPGAGVFPGGKPGAGGAAKRN